MTRSLRVHSASSWHITTIPATALCLLLLPGGVCAFSVPVPRNSLLYRLVDHVDQLQQVQQGSRPAGHGSTGSSGSISSSSEVLVPPPHLFRIPAPGGDVCLIVDEKGAYHAVRDAFPPFGLPVSSTGVVDTQVCTVRRNTKHQRCCIPLIPGMYCTVFVPGIVYEYKRRYCLCTCSSTASATQYWYTISNARNRTQRKAKQSTRYTSTHECIQWAPDVKKRQYWCPGSNALFLPTSI